MPSATLDRLAPLSDAVFRARPDEMSSWYRSWADEVGLERAVCDFLAGMTDRFAVQEHVRLIGAVPPLERP